MVLFHFLFFIYKMRHGQGLYDLSFLLLCWNLRGYLTSFALVIDKDSVPKFHLLAKLSLEASWGAERSCEEFLLNSYLNCDGHLLSSIHEGRQNAPALWSEGQTFWLAKIKKSSEGRRLKNIFFLKHKPSYFLENVIWNCQQFTSGILLVCSRTFPIGFKNH